MIHSAAFSPIPVERLFRLIEHEFSGRKEIFGIPEALFFKPENKPGHSMKMFGHTLHTPFGVAAGPHSQMAQNIISAWLCGASYIELKTIQTLDELDVSKPCIDMQDEGYNCEWSQELRIRESFEEYLKAWIIIHLLQHKFRLRSEDRGGFVFNMSVGYNYEGILKENVQWFLNKMRNCAGEKAGMISALLPLYPEAGSVNIPDCLSDNITLSTMHGCPPDEIEKIGTYLLKEKKLHTFIKLNPTLLGKDALRDILNHQLGFRTTVPDVAFEHDLKYPDAIGIIKRLQQTADLEGLVFGVKLTNTLESLNHKKIFPEHEKMMYMSGRALHPISIRVARKLQNEFEGKLRVSFSAGADCYNMADLLKCGLKPVTVCSDLLKPGGYGRLSQYLDFMDDAEISGTENSLRYLNEYAESVVNNPDYRNDPFMIKNIKMSRALHPFDCIKAPCVDECPTNQDIPEYMLHTSAGDFSRALDIILKKNPFPNVLGSACDHPCQTRCTRINYDEPLKIRDIKLFAAENGKETGIGAAADNGKKVAIIGAGPSGLACAFFLRQAGFAVEIFESKHAAGGMVYDAIPGFRMKMDLLDRDVERILKLGVRIHYNQKIDQTGFQELRNKFDYLYIAAGAQRFRTLGMEGEHAAGVLNAFEFLKDSKRGLIKLTGSHIVVIGGGNTAMDVARTAKRLAGQNASVKVLYRRTRAEMPADREEIEALLDEKIELLELVSPEKIHVAGGRIVSLMCARMKLEDSPSGGRPAPVKSDEPLIEFRVDTLIPALGQETDLDFIDPDNLKRSGTSCETALKDVFIGGDALRGAATIVKAVGDGRMTAKQIAERAGCAISAETAGKSNEVRLQELVAMRSLRKRMDRDIMGFQVNLSPGQAKTEADRCLQCNDVCNVCVSVCPNRANVYYLANPASIPLWQVEPHDRDFRLLPAGDLSVNQKIQVLNIADFCNECGNCTTFCPTSGAPFRDKPRFCLTGRSFSRTDNSYLLTKKNGTAILRHRRGDQVSTLVKSPGGYEYTDPEIELTFNADYKPEKMIFNNPAIQGIILHEAATMKFLIDALEDSFLVCQEEQDC